MSHGGLEEDTGRPITAPAVALFSMPMCILAFEEYLFLCRMFMYIFLGGLVVLMLFGMYQVLETRTVCVFGSFPLTCF